MPNFLGVIICFWCRKTLYRLAYLYRELPIFKAAENMLNCIEFILASGKSHIPSRLRKQSSSTTLTATHNAGILWYQRWWYLPATEGGKSKGGIDCRSIHLSHYQTLVSLSYEGFYKILWCHRNYRIEDSGIPPSLPISTTATLAWPSFTWRTFLVNYSN